jgi:transcriptional regulator with XRE-family HTH domain
MATLKQQVGALIKSRRNEKGIVQAELAARSRRSVEMISRIERGVAAPSFDTLERFAEILGVPVRDFFGAGDYVAEPRRDDALARLVKRVSGLDGEDLDWVDRVVASALNRKVRTAVKPPTG